jgi:uncharacterized protein
MLEKINSDIITALKAGEKPKAEALRLLKSALTNARIAAGHDLSDEECIKVIRKEMKSRVEARDLFRENDRAEQADKEEFERNTYAEYVPEQLSAEVIDKLISEQASGDKTMPFAELMPKVMKAAAGKADGKVVADRVKNYLQG